RSLVGLSLTCTRDPSSRTVAERRSVLARIVSRLAVTRGLHRFDLVVVQPLARGRTESLGLEGEPGLTVGGKFLQHVLETSEGPLPAERVVETPPQLRISNGGGEFLHPAVPDRGRHRLDRDQASTA